MHGHLRNTFDLDLLIADSALATARSALNNLGYRTYFETDAFLQLQAPENLPPIDLMIVDDQTFDRIEATANQKMLDGQQIRIPEDPQPLPRSTDVSTIRDHPDSLSLPTPREPLRECEFEVSRLLMTSLPRNRGRKLFG